MLTELVNRLINWSIGLLAVIAVAMGIYAAYLYLFAAQDEKNVSKANKIFLYVAIGLALALGSKAIVYMVGKLISPSVDLSF